MSPVAEVTVFTTGAFDAHYQVGPEVLGLNNRVDDQLRREEEQIDVRFVFRPLGRYKGLEPQVLGDIYRKHAMPTSPLERPCPLIALPPTSRPVSGTGAHQGT